MRVRASWLLVLVVAVGVAAVVHAAEKPEAAATKQATAWLALVDQGKYGESWDAAATS